MIKTLRSKNCFARPQEQSGLASIVIVAVLVVLLSLISIGFARLMDRAVNGSLNNQLSSSANYAAQSAVNDAVAYLQAQANPSSVTSKSCNDANGANSILDMDGNPNGSSKINPDFSGNQNYKYTCILIDPDPSSLGYSLPPSSSQVTELSTSSGAASKLLFSWQASDESKNNLSAPCSNGKLLDESAWTSNNCPPLLRVTIYPENGGDVSQASSRTYFLYPSSGGGNSLAYNSTADGSLVPIKCNTAIPSGFNGTDPKFCNAVITGLSSSDSKYYLRLTSLYQPGDVGIQANDSGGGVLKFSGVQSLIDVTAQAGTATKRLQARVALSNSSDITPSEDGLPEDGLRSAEAICKQLDVGATVTVQTSFCTSQLDIKQPPAPTIQFCVDNGSDCSASGYTNTSATIADSSSVTLRWNIAEASTCSISSSPAWSGPTAGSAGPSTSTTTGALSGGAAGGAGADYQFTINSCNGRGGSAGPVTISVHVNAPGSGCAGACGCGSSCGGANSITAFEFDPAQPNEDDFILTTQNNPGYCVIFGNTDLAGGVGIWAPVNGQYEYNFGPASDTHAEIDCADTSAIADRGGGGDNSGCDPNSQEDPYDHFVMLCINDTHTTGDQDNGNSGALITCWDEWSGPQCNYN